MNRILIAGLASLLAIPALAQSARPPSPAAAPPGTIVVREGGDTGRAGNTVVAPGSTGASTIETNSAAAGNAGQPERAVPQSSGGGNGGGQ